jgi:hypothetical protein
MKLQLLVGCATALLAIASSAQAAEQRLTLVGARPLAVSLKQGTATIGVTVRNDSRFDGPLTARIELDTGQEQRTVSAASDTGGSGKLDVTRPRSRSR